MRILNSYFPPKDALSLSQKEFSITGHKIVPEALWFHQDFSKSLIPWQPFHHLTWKSHTSYPSPHSPLPPFSSPASDSLPPLGASPAASLPISPRSCHCCFQGVCKAVAASRQSSLFLWCCSVSDGELAYIWPVLRGQQLWHIRVMECLWCKGIWNDFAIYGNNHIWPLGFPTQYKLLHNQHLTVKKEFFLPSQNTWT